MSSDNDKCFQCQKLATWHTIVLISDALTVTIIDTLQQIALTKYHLQAHQQDSDQHLGIIATPGIPTGATETGTDSVNLDLTHITLNTGVTVAVILKAILDHFISPHTVALHATRAPTHTTTAETHHITDPPHAGTSPKMTVDPEHINPTRHHDKPKQRSSSSSQSTPWKPKDMKVQTGYN